MFQKTRVKLTLLYLIIIMAVSIFFSAFIYAGATQEFDRVIRVQEYRNLHPELRERVFQNPSFGIDQMPDSIKPDPQVLEDARARVFYSLFGINLIILVFSGLFGYFLAGRTLYPIKEMVDEQNRFITDASHELSTPLTSLKTSIEVTLRDKKFTTEKARKLLESNLDDVDNLQLLSDELIKLTQYQKPNSNFNFEKISLRDVIAESISKIKPMAGEKDIKIKSNLPKAFVDGDYRSLVELFIILLDNAIKYSKTNTLIEIKSREKELKVEVSIIDNGVGIEKSDLDYIFDRFYRSDKSRTKQNFSGYGLGLSIAQRIVKLHKGEIFVKSEIEKGSTFTVSLDKA